MGTTKENIVVQFITKGVRRYKKDMKGMEDNSEELTKNINRLGSSGAKMGRRFAIAHRLMRGFRMEFLGIMFGGMLLMRTFQGIMRSAVQTFMKISEGATPAGRAITALSAEMAFLKFTIGRVLGEALLPLLPKIIAIINKFREWVSAHPKLVARLLMVGFVLGIMLFFLGSMALLLSSLITLFGPKGLVGAMRFFSKVGKSTAAKTAVAWVGAAAKTAAAWFVANMAMIGMWVLIFIGIIALFAAVVYIGLEWKKLWLGIKMGGAMVFNALLGYAETWINGWLWGINKIIAGMNKMGANIPKLEADFSSWKIDMSGFDDELAALGSEPSAWDKIKMAGAKLGEGGFFPSQEEMNGQFNDLNQTQNINGDIVVNVGGGDDPRSNEDFMDWLWEQIGRQS
jgi:hypothetical protein